jgi:hypothetical protein
MQAHVPLPQRVESAGGCQGAYVTIYSVEPVYRPPDPPFPNRVERSPGSPKSIAPLLLQFDYWSRFNVIQWIEIN